jgi:Lrp/AsnC family leucine-responsive transcriptional regulator
MKVLVSSISELEELIMKLLDYGVPTTSIVLSTPLVRSAYRVRRGKKAAESSRRR